MILGVPSGRRLDQVSGARLRFELITSLDSISFSVRTEENVSYTSSPIARIVQDWKDERLDCLNLSNCLDAVSYLNKEID